MLLTADEHCVGRQVDDKRFQIESMAISARHCKIYRKKKVGTDEEQTYAALKDTRLCLIMIFPFWFTSFPKFLTVLSACAVQMVHILTLRSWLRIPLKLDSVMEILYHLLLLLIMVIEWFIYFFFIFLRLLFFPVLLNTIVIASPFFQPLLFLFLFIFHSLTIYVFYSTILFKNGQIVITFRVCWARHLKISFPY